MNSTSWSYIAILGTVSNAICAGVNSMLGINPRPELALMLFFMLVGAAASAWQTYRYYWGKKKEWRVVVTPRYPGALVPQLYFGTFAAGLYRFLDEGQSGQWLSVMLMTPDHGVFHWRRLEGPESLYVVPVETADSDNSSK